MNDIDEITEDNKTLQAYYDEVSDSASITRALGTAWYKDLDQDVQIHIYADPQSASSSVFIKKSKQWINGPRITSNMLMDTKNKQQIYETITDFIITNEDFNSATGFSVFLHGGYSSELTTLKTQYESEQERDEDLEQNASTSLTTTDTADDTIWKYMPIGIKSYGGACSVIKSRTQILKDQPDYVKTPKGKKPIFWGYYVASSEIVSLYPIILQNLEETKRKELDAHNKKNKEKGLEAETLQDIDINIMVFNYNQHTLIVPIDKNLEIDQTQITNITHQYSSEPKNLSSSVSNMIINTGAQSPQITFFALGNCTVDRLTESLHDEDFDDFEFDITVENGQHKDVLCAQLEKATNAKVNATNMRPEYFAFNQDQLDSFFGEDEIPYTVEDLRKSIPKQNFLQKSNTFIPRNIIICYLASKLIIILFFLALIAYVIVNAIGYIKAISSESWKLSSAEVTAVSTDLQKSIKEKQSIEQWERLLTPKSRAWTQLELLKTLIPENSGITVKELKYELTNQPTNRRTTGRKKVTPTLFRKWIIDGECTKVGSDYLTKLTSQKNLQKVFNDFADKTNQEQFKAYTDTGAKGAKRTNNIKTRPIELINKKIERLKGKDREFSHSFTLTFEQEYTEKDPHNL